MDLEIIILSDISQREKDKHHTISLICEILKKNTDELTCRKETDSQTLKTNLRLPKGTGYGEGWIGSLGWHMHTVVYRMIGQQRNCYVA